MPLDCFANDKPRISRFQAVALPYLDDAYNLARWLTRDPQDAEDVVQEAYLRALRYFDNFRGENPRGWVLTIVRNTFYTCIRAKRSKDTRSLNAAPGFRRGRYLGIIGSRSGYTGDGVGEEGTMPH
jgi:DNA-directed RNA polymerase specialized sigma24 family protein